jgi:tRNA threonylcarbamoyladenosine biosynthesis protein TsaB
MAKKVEHTGPFILAMDTATPLGSVALFSGDVLLGQIEYRRAKSHARLLSSMVRQLVEDMEVEMKALSAIAVADGPGSYTGLRVSTSTAKGLCMALDKPLMSVPSLEGIAWQVQDLAQQMDARIISMLDARRMEVYCQQYDAQLQAETGIEAKIIEDDAFAELLSAHKVIFVGDGVAKCRDVLSASPNAIFLPEALSSAANLGSALWRKFQAADFEDLVGYEPFYLKPFRATKAKNPLL